MLLAVGNLGAAQAQTYTHQIAPGVYSHGTAQQYQSMFLVTDEGVAVFETVNSKHAAGLVKAIRKITDKPIVYAFHSHNHWDHASGGKVFQDLGAKTVMHEFAAKWLKANPGQDTSPPNIIMKGARQDFELGGVTIEAHYLGQTHGMGMTVYLIPKTKSIYIADLVTPNRVMFNVVPDFNIGGWQRALGEIKKLDFENGVCSHNENPAKTLPNGCDRVDIEEELQYMVDLKAAIIAEFKKGTADVAGAIKLPQYAHWAHYDDWLEMNAWRVMLDMYMGPFPWNAEQ
ncbi:MBL fold metallo-hydrolase [Candidatus Nitrotoga sp. M5]|uniref:MBL fold metallo-hydrolase n=1 Tax=Candidatus Nitrotoga sp. M5 TaxID=2890409 RepID=UPI001EF212DB|nr:MBL fold metallo-hydrolase [Candidatus Nitrotoga sp. M5]CAH1386976.1 Lactamase_B domain-containing protein [Candidatus Nitrotoga sp. M5]